jgi:hypothetical protein
LFTVLEECVDTISAMTESFYRDGPGSRWTPDPARMRQAALGFLSAGFYVGLAGALLPLLANHFTFSAAIALQWQAALLGGTVLGAQTGRWLARLPSGIQAVNSAGAMTTAAALAALAVIPGMEPMNYAAALIGLGAGLACVASSYSLDGVLSAGRAASALDLAAACFGFGALCGGLLLVVLRQGWPLNQSAGIAAALLLLTALGIRLRGSPPEAVASAVLTHHWHDMVRPTRVLLSFCLALQAALWGVAALGLGFYASRSLGTPPGWSVGLLVLYWAGWVIGRTSVIRAARLGLLRTSAAVAAFGALACLFLANTEELPGAVAGALLLGAASGSMQAIVQSLAGGPDVALRMVGRFFASTVIAGLVAATGTGLLLQAFGVRTIVWAVALIGALLCVGLAVLAVEARLAARPVEA